VGRHVIILDATAPVPAELRGASVAIGNFDGVHRGHQALLAEAQRAAAAAGRPWGVITFEPHPRSFFRPSEPVFRLSPAPLKARLLAALGADFMLPLTFDAALAGLEAEAFIERVLGEKVGVGHLVTGFDFHFGKGRKGNADLLRSLGPRLGFTLAEVEQVTDPNGSAPFSSSAIRSALRHGSVAPAAHDLGYWWSVLGTVTTGDGRGQSIGFPTANLQLVPGTDTRDGIYAVRVRDLAVAPPRAALPGAAYIGTRPTFGSERRFLEVHLLEFSGDLYGRELLVEFLAFIRPDRTFQDAASLAGQIGLDCQACTRAIAEVERTDPMRAFRLGRLQSDGKI
jgi:riboflavin kinase / FMN adenylyltransferase